MNSHKKNKNKFLAGFTMVEMIVVMALFLLVIGAAISVFISMVSDQKRALSEQQFLNQISYVQEYISKALRMAEPELGANCLLSGEDSLGGYIYLLTRPDPTGLYRGIKFINQ
jgi:prepilin-type N-terminal cleavage/methylation domain-containing protein